MGRWINIATHRHVPPRSLPISTTSEKMPELRVGELMNQPVNGDHQSYTMSTVITRVTRCQQTGVRLRVRIWMSVP